MSPKSAGYRFYGEPLEISVDTWVEILEDPAITTTNVMEILTYLFKSENYEARAKEISFALGRGDHGPMNSQIGRYGRRIVEKTGVQPPINDKGSERWWNVPFLGYDMPQKRCPWILRPELATAFERLYGKADAICEYPGEAVIEDPGALAEGAQIPVLVNRYERSRRARSLCIAHYGAKCTVCGFDFASVYGEIGKNKMHVHHIVPVSKIKETYQVDPIKDLRPVCPNCHFIIHSRKEPFTIEEVRALIERQISQ